MTPLRHSRNFLSGIHAFAFSFDFKDCGPRLKDCRGDERRVIEAFRGRLKTA